jgi:hypothetical protein
METIWVLENVKKDYSFYSRLQILMLIASVSLWKKYHPNHKTVFYCDEMSNEVLSELDIFYLWDEVRPLSYPEKINREIFWSSPKTKIISETQIPLLIIDHDFLVFKNIDEYLKNEVLFSYHEYALNWYPSKNDVFNKKLSNPIKFVNEYAANVSLFYLPNPEFAREYGLQTLKNHEEFTAMDNSNIDTNYMILSEQLMLLQWLDERNIPYKSLSKNLWDCKKVNYIDKEIKNGIWNKQESLLSYKHYGVEEERIKENQEGYSYDDTLSFLYRCIKAGKLINIDLLKEKIKIIQNL